MTDSILERSRPRVPLPGHLRQLLGAEWAELRTESLTIPAIDRVAIATDALTADSALRRTSQGDLLVYDGDYHNARQLLAALRRRTAGRAVAPGNPLGAFQRERAQRGREHHAVSRILVPVSPDGALPLRRAPDVAAAVEAALGPREGFVLVPLIEILGMIGAWEWQKKGAQVPGLSRPLIATYGVFGPTRSEPSGLVAGIPDVTGKTFLDVGCGTGVLSLILLGQGAASGIASDVDPRAVACARLNAERHRVASRLKVLEGDLFSDVAADIVVSNPPWLPGVPQTRYDAAIYDPDSRFLRAFIADLPSHLKPDGRGFLILSDLAERIGLRGPTEIADAAARAGLELRELAALAPSHGKAHDKSDPLHAVRSQERVRLLELRPRAQVV